MCCSMSKEFKSLSSTLNNIIRKYNLDESYADYNVIENWNAIVNNNISKIIKPIKIENHILYLQAKTDSWKKESESLKIKIIETVNVKLYPYQIEDINFI